MSGLGRSRAKVELGDPKVGGGTLELGVRVSDHRIARIISRVRLEVVLVRRIGCFVTLDRNLPSVEISPEEANFGDVLQARVLAKQTRCFIHSRTLSGATS